MIGLRAGYIFGHARSLETKVMKAVSELLLAGSQPSNALGQAINVMAGAAGAPEKEALASEGDQDKSKDQSPKDADKEEPGSLEQGKDGKQADASPAGEGQSEKRADVPPDTAEMSAEEKS